MAVNAMGLSVDRLAVWDKADPPTYNDLLLIAEAPLGFVHERPARGTRQQPEQWIYVMNITGNTWPKGTPIHNAFPIQSDQSDVLPGNQHSIIVQGVTQQEFPPYCCGFVQKSGIAECIVVDETTNNPTANRRHVLTTPLLTTPLIDNVPPACSVDPLTLVPNGANTLARGTFGYVVFPQFAGPGGNLAYVYLDCRGG